MKNTNSTGPLVSVVPLSMSNCTQVNVGVRSNVLPNGPFGGIPWDRTNTTLVSGEKGITIDLRTGFMPPPFTFNGSLYIFVDNGYGNCTFDVSVDFTDAMVAHDMNKNK